MKMAKWMVVLALGLAACGDEAPADQTTTEVIRSEKQRVTSPDVSDAQLDELVAGNTEFALNLLREIRTTNAGNVIYSPHSISIALAMTYAGARTVTETEMASALHFTLPQNELHPAFNALDLKLVGRGQDAAGSDDEPFRLKIANAMWLQEGADFEMSFLDTLAENYGAGVNLMDYDTDPEAARLEINAWVEDQTEDKIKNLIPDGAITPDTVAVLTNAIYFNAAWEDQFEEGATVDAPFEAPAGIVNVPTMKQMADYGHSAQAGFEAIELPYDGGEVSMVVLLPDAASDLATLEGNLDAATIQATFAALQTKKIELSFPKFKFESPIGLNEMLRNLGMPSAFDAADFSGISKTMSLAITDVLHKAFIDVNEKGTEAAAATAVIIGETSVPVADLTIEVDRPFLVLIRDRETDAVIFIGRVVDPSN